MVNCGRPDCHKCSTPPRCARGNKCPRCKIAPTRQPKTKYELDRDRINKVPRGTMVTGVSNKR